MRGAAAAAVDSGRAEDSGLHRVRAGIEDQIVDVLVEGIRGEADQVLHGGPVVVFTVRVLAQLVVVAHRLPAEDAAATGVQPEAWVVLGVARCEALGNGFCRRLVVGGICCV